MFANSDQEVNPQWFMGKCTTDLSYQQPHALALSGPSFPHPEVLSQVTGGNKQNRVTDIFHL